MQATVRAKGLKPGRSGLLSVVLVFAAGLALGALAWAAIEEYRADSGNDAALRAPVGGIDGHSEGLTNKYAETYVGPGEPNFDSTGRDTPVNPASYAEPGEPNLTPRDQYRLINGEASEGVIQAHHSDGAGDGRLGGFTVDEPELPLAHHSDGMGEGWLGTGQSVDPGFAQDPVGQPGIGYFA